MEAIKKIIGMVVLIGCISITNVYGQYRFEGRVYDSVSGLELADVNLAEEISKLRTVSDSLGRFTIVTIRDRVRIRFSRVGYEEIIQEYVVSESPIRIYLQPSPVNIEEIQINTGYQWIPKERATGSFVHVDQKQLEAIPGRSVIDKLDGIMPGLQFDKRTTGATSVSTPVVTVRGMNAFSTAASAPLIVVDNFPYEGDIETLDPNEVESVTLLRDAAATSIWGARAGNGVLVINLKKPDKSGKTQVGWSSNLSVTERPDLYYQPSISSSEFVDVELFLYDQGYYRGALSGSNAYLSVFSPVVQALYDLETGKIDENELNGIISKARHHDYRDDLLKHYYRNMVNHRHHLSLSKRTGGHSLRFSVGLDQIDGKYNMAVGNQRETRYSFNFFNEYEFSSKLSATLDVGYFLGNDQSVAGFHYPFAPEGGKTRLYPYAELIDDHGQALPMTYRLNPNFLDTVGNGYLLDWRFRPYEDSEHHHNESRTSRINPTIKIRYNPVTALHFDFIYSANYQITKDDTRYGVDSYEVRNNVNMYSQVVNEQVIHQFPMGEIYRNAYDQLNAHKFRFTSSMENVLFDRHRFSWIIGGELSDVQNNRNSHQVYGYNPLMATHIPVDHIYRYPMFLGGTGTIPDRQNFNWEVQRMVSFFGNASYAIDRKYIFSGSIRRDASNYFGVKANERWNPLWSVGFAWNLHNERIFKDSDWISDFRFRITHGHSGNLGGGATSDRVIIRNNGNAALTGLPTMMISSPPNPLLKWVNVQMNNFAVDFGIFNNRLNLGLEYYMKKVTDLISSDPIDPTTGYNSMSRNVAKIDGKGFDMNINAEAIRGAFNWRIGTSISYARDWTKEFYGTPVTTSALVSGDNSVRPIPGKTLVPVFSYRFAGLDPENGNPLGYLNGEITSDYSAISRDSLHNLNYHGSGRPVYHGFVNHMMSYKGLSLFANFAFRAGHYYKASTIAYSRLYGSWDTHRDFNRRWQQPGDESFTTVPSMIYPVVSSRDNFYAYSEANVRRGDVIRLQQVRLTYRWSNPIRKISAIDVGVHVNNVGIVWKAAKTERDPDYFSIPPSRTISTNINIQF